MRIEEKNAIVLARYPKEFVYFLLKENEVVYVGQTTNGISRPLSHRRTKEFDDIAIVPCDRRELDRVEQTMIAKYDPPLNKCPNHKEKKSVKELIKEIKGKTGSMTPKRMERIMAELGIKPMICAANRSRTITQEEAERIRKACGTR